MISVKLLTHDAKVPTRGSTEAAGLDLYAISSEVINPGERKLLDTGIAISLMPSTYARIAPRSGLAVKNGIDVMAGVVDSDYRGSLKVCLINLGDKPFNIAKHDRIAQLIVEHCILVEPVVVKSLESTDRGNGGFGSTGI